MGHELHVAAADASEQGFARVKQLVEEEKADVNKVHRKYGTTPLAFAMQLGSLQTIQYLLEKGASLNARRSEENMLYWALQNSAEVVAFITDADNKLIEQFQDGTTKLHVAAAKGDIADVARMLKDDPTRLFEANDHHQTLFSWASYGSQDELFGQLITLVGDGILAQQINYKYLLKAIEALLDEKCRKQISDGLRLLESSIAYCESIKDKTHEDYMMLTLLTDLFSHKLYTQGKLVQAISFSDQAIRYCQSMAASDEKSDYMEDILTYKQQLVLKHQAQVRGLECQDVRGDGDCFFHAVREQLKLLKSPLARLTSEDLRAIAANHIFQNYQQYDGFIDGDVVERTKEGNWVDHVTIQALSRELNLTLVILKSDGSAPEIIKRQEPTATLKLGYIVNLHYLSLAKDPEIEPEIALHEEIQAAPVDAFVGVISPLVIPDKKNAKQKQHTLKVSSPEYTVINPDGNDSLTLRISAHTQSQSLRSASPSILSEEETEEPAASADAGLDDIRELYSAAADPSEQGIVRVRRCVEEAHTDVNVVSREHRLSLLAIAAQSGTRETVEYLIAKGASLDASETDENVLYWAIQNTQHPEVLAYLTHPENDLIKKLNDQTTDLHAAAATGDLARVTRILKKNKNRLLEASDRYETAFHWASRGKHEVVFGHLIFVLGLTIMAQDDTEYAEILECARDLYKEGAEQKQDAVKLLENAILFCEALKEKRDHDYWALANFYYALAFRLTDQEKLSEAIAAVNHGLSNIDQMDAGKTKSELLHNLTLFKNDAVFIYQAKLRGYACFEVAGNGDRFFDVIKAQLERLKIAPVTKTAEEWHSIAVKHVICNYSEYKDFMIDGLRPYLKLDHWADQILILALSRELNVTLAIVQSDDDNPVQIIKPANPIATLTLGYLKDKHYWSLVPDAALGQTISLQEEIAQASIDEFNGIISLPSLVSVKDEKAAADEVILKAAFPETNDVSQGHTAESESELKSSTGKRKREVSPLVSLSLLSQNQLGSLNPPPPSMPYEQEQTADKEDASNQEPSVKRRHFSS